MNKEKSNKTQRGITLIALVITIIVMLILVAVTITMAVNGGLFQKASEAGQATNEAVANEQILASGKVTIDNEQYNSIDEFIANGNKTESEVIEPPTEYEESYDISANGDGSVMAYLVERKGETDKYDMLITGTGAMTNGYHYGSYYNVRPYDDLKDSIITAKISKGVTNIGNSIFGLCTSLREVIIPDSVEEIGHYTFYGCTNLPNITMPDSVKNIGQNVFTDCTRLENVKISSSLEFMQFVFLGCTSLTSVKIPKSVMRIGENFTGSTNLSTIIYEGTTAEWAEIELAGYWADGVPATTVQCSDGTVNI